MPSRVAAGPTMTGVALDLTHRLVSVPGGRIHLGEQGTRPARAARPRLPRVVVLVAAPAAGARRGRLPGGRDRRPRLRALVQAGRRRRPTGCSTTSPTTSASCEALGEQQPRSSSATTGARRSRRTRRCCAPTCSARWPAERAVLAAAAGRRPTESSPGWAATRSSTSATSRRPGRAEAEIEPDVRGWLPASTPRCPAARWPTDEIVSRRSSAAAARLARPVPRRPARRPG